MRITIALESHKDIINNLLRNNLEQSTYEEYPEELLNSYLEDNRKYILIGDEFVRYIGFIFFTENKEEGYISLDEVIIDKKYLNRGYEEILLNQVLKYAKCWGISNVKVNKNIANADVENVILNYGFNCEFGDSYTLKLKNEKI